MVWLVMLFSLVVGAVGQSLWPTWAWLGQARVPLLLGLVLYYALNHPAHVMLVAALMAGVFHDAMSQIPLGYSSLWFCLAGWIASRSKGTVLTDSALTQFMFGGLASAFFSLGSFVMLARTGRMGPGVGMVALKVLGSGLLGFIVVPLVCWAIARLERCLGAVERKEGLIDAFE